MGKRKLRWFAMLLAFVLLAGVGSASAAAPVEQRTVRVGYFAFDGYHMQDENGLRSGYGYDFLQMALRYTDWKLEYVGYNLGWGDMLDMLENGEIDLVTSAQKTPEREAKFAFSDEAIGTSTIVLTVRADDDRYASGDYSGYNGMRVGLIADSSRNLSFEAFAAEHGFTYTPVYYQDNDGLEVALQSGLDIDAILTSSLRRSGGEKALEQFATSSFYAMVRKDDPSLLGELNSAIAQMDRNESGWQTTLHNRYYGTSSTESASLTLSERDFLTKARENGTVFRVVGNPDLRPYSYCENGEMKGIVPEIFEEIARRLELPYEYVITETYPEYLDLVQNGEIDIDLTCFFDYSLAENQGVRMTDPYMTTALALLTRASFTAEPQTIAVMKHASMSTTYHDKLMNGKQTMAFDSLAKCAEAVLSGRADGLYTYAYTAQRLAEQDERRQLKYALLSEYTVELAIGVNALDDHRLLTVLNKGVQSVSGDYAQQVIQKNVGVSSRPNTLLSLLYDHPGASVLAVLLVLGCAFATVLVLTKARSMEHRRRQERELSRFMGYVCASNDVVMEVNADDMTSTRYQLANGRIVGIKEPYRFGDYRNPNDAIHPDDFERIVATVPQTRFESLVAKGGGEQYFEARVKGEDGEYRWYSYTLRAIPKDAEHPNNFILFKKNIDAVKRAEAEQRQVLQDALENARHASSAKGQFLSRMSHEIRTPLNAIIGYLSIANDSADNPEKVMHCVDNSAIAAKHLLSIINDVLDISSIESGKMKIANEDFDLRKQITSVSTIFFNQAKAKNVNFDCAIRELTEEWVVGDSLRVNQVLMNLLSNAVKFTPEQGKVSLNVTQMGLSDADVFIKFEVSDTGIGMSEEYQKRLFKPFEQESAVTAQKYGGTGLGLSITMNLVTMMGGSIEVHSKQNEGTTFVVTLHFRRSQRNETEHQATRDYSRLRALVVDDEQSTCDYVKSLLKRCGVKCDTVTDGESAIKQIKRRMGGDYAYNLCIMDWNMPQMNGVDTAKRIRAECDKELPIIIATAYDTTEFEDQAKEIGVSKVISKPLFQSTMFDLLVSTFGKYQPTPATEEKRVKLDGIRILLAEDNPMNLEIAVEVLTKAGVKVDTAENGKLAAECFLAEPAGTYQAILMDIQMPVMNGYEATERIRASEHAEAKSMPIIAMTANAFSEDVSEALSHGMNDHIAKPIDYDKLFRVLERCMKHTEDEKHG